MKHLLRLLSGLFRLFFRGLLLPLLRLGLRLLLGGTRLLGRGLHRAWLLLQEGRHVAFGQRRH